MHKIKDKIEDLKQQALSDNFEISNSAFSKLRRIGNEAVFNFFIKMLKHKDVRIKYAAASELRKIADERAVKPLLDAINDPVNEKYSASFMYALQTHNCSNLFPSIIIMALKGSYELKVHALEILRRQKFNITRRDLAVAKDQLGKHKDSKLNNEDYGSFVKTLSALLVRIEQRLIREEEK